jgi:hypothetical protein
MYDRRTTPAGGRFSVNNATARVAAPPCRHLEKEDLVATAAFGESQAPRMGWAVSSSLVIVSCPQRPLLELHRLLHHYFAHTTN